MTGMKILIQSILILIAVLISTTGADEVVYAQVGDSVTLKAPPLNTQAKYVNWFLDKEGGSSLAWCNHLGGKGFISDASWKNKLELSDTSLIIRDIQQENFVTLVVTLDNQKTSSITYRLSKLTVSMDPPSPLLPGDRLSLACNTETPQHHKKPQIYWLDPKGEPIRPDKETVTKTASTQDNGTWTCVIKHDKVDKKAPISVTVVDLSPAPLQPQYTSKSTPLIIPCSIPSHISWEQIKAKGITEVHWHFFPKTSSGHISDHPVKLYSLSLGESLSWIPNQTRDLNILQDLKTGNLSLTRKQGREEDRGNYVCTMKFKNVNLNRTVEVEVLQIISSPGTNLISGQALNLTCGLGHPLPSNLQVRWSPPGQTSLPSLKSGPHPAHLTIAKVSTENGGTWACALLQDKKQLISVTIKLKIEPKLSTSMLVIICSAAVIVLLLLILVLILYRQRQRKMRHLRHQLCRCKNPKPKGFYRT
ncbi:CD4-1 molecule [Toxotes jaculatrix]|uniref:CD4-1 molecule n=1 Tax=Toxotes jaculatrix TaxID=941984 RepID=UPI001B3AE321|nr:CD4-1 molecule [Toxotes jaculatrix]